MCVRVVEKCGGDLFLSFYLEKQGANGKLVKPLITIIVMHFYFFNNKINSLSNWQNCH